ncbi:FAD-linked oxidase C-terminal domain-containing protein [Sphingobium sp. CR2-8]|uniref:FAD-linked oxidase C-terminal domain-containing protein n=1 Tax=Sphingobium sp. CR2-8 TaxID=1306534 RepID=UPI003FA38940
MQGALITKSPNHENVGDFYRLRIGKQESLIAERGAHAVAIMAMIKQTLDPGAIFNPGKIFAGPQPLP